jgi:hypothetical protein
MDSETNSPRTRKASPTPRRTRTDRDWVMLSLGVLLIFIFLVIGYFSILPRGKGTSGVIRGPVKNPNAVELQSAPEEAPLKQK